MYRVTYIPGDGIGPEVVAAAIQVVNATGVEIEWEEAPGGQVAIPEHGSPVPAVTLESIRRNRVALKGPLTNVVGKGFPSPNMTLRKELDLYANLRLAKLYPGVRSRFEQVDLVAIRESMEDTFQGVEQKVGEDAAVALKFITRRGAERASRFAFEYARQEGRKKVTVLHKANILKLTDGLFLRTAQQVAQDYPEVEFEERMVDNMCMQLVLKPEQYDVLLMPNVYGDLVMDLAAALAGGLGMGPGGNFGDGAAVFESVHGSVPKYAGLDKVNPGAMILTGALMLRHLGEVDAANRIESAVAAVVRDGIHVTYDLGGRAGTREMAEAIVVRV
ncbi:MAG: isocitrate/isopropylmalate dehydrogenase family protein [Chloroflexi bacterium]|nr:isocitrate/isopropylmalate dehydrogenase family protein [Chloroflexota bacterium]